MLQNNLNRLMGERNLKISDLCRGTGLAKNTISALSRGTTAGIQFDTFEKICSFLQITPGEFFDYSPYVLETKLQTKLSDLKENHFQYLAHITNSVYVKDFILNVTLSNPIGDPKFPRTDTSEFDLYVKIDLLEDPKYSPEELFSIIETFPSILKRKFYQQLVEDIVTQLNNCTKKGSTLPVYDSLTEKIKQVTLTKHQHCVFDIFSNTPCHKLIDLEFGTDELTL